MCFSYNLENTWRWNDDPEVTWTPDLLIWSQTRYQLRHKAYRLSQGFTDYLSISPENNKYVN